uniref:Uncharacterized protein n=1 Tax=Meloidogyne enterolobii TaxID=390850 RepID=A0A6V7UDN4_MELEN|nr:unnamed protein product [Meloidogyne enterolobii]
MTSFASFIIYFKIKRKLPKIFFKNIKSNYYGRRNNFHLVIQNSFIGKSQSHKELSL